MIFSAPLKCVPKLNAELKKERLDSLELLLQNYVITCTHNAGCTIIYFIFFQIVDVELKMGMLQILDI